MPVETVHWLASGLVFLVALVFSMLGLGGGMLYVPLFKWLELPLKTVAIPLGLLLNRVTTASALVRYAREGLVDYRGGLPAALAALAAAPLGAHATQYVPKDLLIGLFAGLTLLAASYSLKSSAQPEARMAQAPGGVSPSAWPWAVARASSAPCWEWAAASSSLRC